MKVVIFGASGRTGKLVVQEALDKGHLVTAYVRRSGALTVNQPNLKVVTGQLDDTVKIKEAINGADACISVLGGGSLTRTSTQFTDGIDRIVFSMEQKGVNRFIYLSSIGAGASRFFMQPVIRFLVAGLLLRVPLADHTTNEERISRSKLQWTVVRPGVLTDGVKTGKISHGSDFINLKGNPRISRADVASFMVDQLTGDEYLNKGVWLL